MDVKPWNHTGFFYLPCYSLKISHPVRIIGAPGKMTHRSRKIRIIDDHGTEPSTLCISNVFINILRCDFTELIIGIFISFVPAALNTEGRLKSFSN